MPSLYIFVRRTIGPIVRALFPAHVVGKENLPEHGPYIIAAGPHRTELESLLLACYLNKRQIHFFAKEDYWSGRFKSWLMDSIGMLKLNRRDSRVAAKQIERGAEILAAGGVIGVYPEGTRGADNFLHKGHTGTVRTALLASKQLPDGNVPIVPVGMIGMRKLNPPGRRLALRPGRCTIIIGEPIYPLMHNPEELQSRSMELAMNVIEGDSMLARPATNVHARLLTTRLMKTISRLSTARYLDEYLKIGAAAKSEVAESAE